MIHRIRNTHEVLEELRRHVLVIRIMSRQLESDRQHRRTIKRHPGRTVRLMKSMPLWQRLRTIEETDIVQA